MTQPTSAGPARALASAVLFLGVVLALIGVVQVVNQLTQPGATVEVLIEEQLLGLGDVDGVPAGAWLQVANGGELGGGGGWATVSLQVGELPAGLRALSETPFLAGGLLALAGAVVLRRLLLEIAAGRPFDVRNPGRLQALAGLVLVAGILPGALASLATIATLEHLGAADSPLGFNVLDLSFEPLLLSAALFVAAQVFSHGQRLTEDVEGLV